MRWSYPICRVAGISVYVHATFGLLLLWFGSQAYDKRHEWLDVASSLIFIVCLFTIVVMHELGHALTARQFGIKTLDITLLPIGGVARMERIPTDPKQELLVAIAGPAVNVVLAGVFLAALIALGMWAGDAETMQKEMTTFGGSLLGQLLVVNVWLVLFNLLPAFPMDGGRVLRALLAMRMDYVKATRVAAEVGQVMAVLFGLFGLFGPGSPLLLLIAVFVWVGAAAEANAVAFKAGLAGIPVEGAMIREFHSLAPHDSLADAAHQALGGFQDDFPVIVDGSVVGVLPRMELLAGLTESGMQGRVENYMRTDFRTADPREMLEPVFNRLNDGGCRVMPVVQQGRLVGLLSADKVAELMLFRQAINERSKPQEV